MHGGIGWQGIIPSRAAKMGSIAVDKGIARWARRGTYDELDPEQIAQHILATARGETRELVERLMEREHIGDELTDGPASDRTRRMIETAMGPAVDRAVGPASPAVRVVGRREYDAIRSSVAAEAVDYTTTPLSDPDFHPRQSPKVREMIAGRMRELAPGDYSEMLQTAMREDEWLLYLHGAVLGFGGGLIHLALFGYRRPGDVSYSGVGMASKVAGPGRMSGERRREQLLDVTKAIVAERGFHAVSIEAVAREAGISRPIVYGHFSDLSGLLEALVEREGRRALDQLTGVLPIDLTGGDARELLLAGLQGYLEAVEGDPATWRLVLMPPEGAPDSLRERIELGRAAVVAQLAEAVRPGLAPGRESPDPELTARTLSAFADEAARLLLTDARTYPVERLLAHARWLLANLS